MGKVRYVDNVHGNGNCAMYLLCYAKNKLDLVANPQTNVSFFASKGVYGRFPIALGLYVFAGKTRWVVPTEDK